MTTDAEERQLFERMSRGSWLDRIPLFGKPCSTTHLRAALPRTADTPRSIVEYVLSVYGAQCLCKLKLLTGLSSEDVRAALRSLLDDRQIERIEGTDATQEIDETTMFRLTKPSPAER